MTLTNIRAPNGHPFENKQEKGIQRSEQPQKYRNTLEEAQKVRTTKNVEPSHTDRNMTTWLEITIFTTHTNPSKIHYSHADPTEEENGDTLRTTLQ